MNLRKTLNRLMRVVIDEAERNSNFETALIEALGGEAAKHRLSDAAGGSTDYGPAKRGKNRRAPAALDPIQVVRNGEPTLRNALEKLSLEQLRDIVAEYGMDPGRVVMKWATPDRVINRIVEMSITRAHKGSAFRKPPNELPPLDIDADQVAHSDTQSIGESPVSAKR